MNELTYFSALVLGVVQGLTEFLPISSSGHLAITQRWLSLDPHGPQMLLFDVCAHVGTVMAILVVFARPLTLWLSRLASERCTEQRTPGSARHIAGMLIVATIVTGALGLSFKHQIESVFERPRWIGGALVVTGFLLLFTKVVPRQRRGWRQFRWWQAALVGLVQACAIVPGISRSGATICVASYCGLRRRWAAEFSFLIAVPAIVGAACVKALDTVGLPAEELGQVSWGATLVGTGVSFLVGVVALRLLLSAVRCAKMHYFAPYCFLIGVLLLAGVL